MKATFIGRKTGKIIRKFCILILCVVSLLILTGCPSSRVSMWTRGQAGAPIKPEDVKMVSTFKDIGSSYNVAGLLSAMALPRMKNSAERREIVVKEIAAEQGIDTIIGFQPKIGELFWDTTSCGIAVGILAHSGFSSNEISGPPPKFIVCLPPVKFKIDKDPSMEKLDDFLRDCIQFYFSSMKGYYVYRTALPINSISNMPVDNFMTLGIPADYVLNCVVEGYDETGNIVTGRVKALKIKMSLFDLKERKTVWAQTTEGISLQYSLMEFLLTGPVGLLEHKLTTPSDEFRVVNGAIKNVLDTVPPAIAGFKGREM
jgi:hypothetical protein